MGLRQEQSNFARALGKLLAYLTLMNYEYTLGDTYPGKFQHRKGSFHEKGLAIDINLFNNKGEYLQTTEDHKFSGAYWRALGGTWGGDFERKDGNHYSWGEK
jgi:hypothetical protein